MARLCELISPLGDKLRFARMTASEGLSRLFDIQLEAVSEQADIAPRELIGKSLTVKVTYEEGAVRHFNGYVTRMSISASRGLVRGGTTSAVVQATRREGSRRSITTRSAWPGHGAPTARTAAGPSRGSSRSVTRGSPSASPGGRNTSARAFPSASRR